MPVITFPINSVLQDDFFNLVNSVSSVGFVDEQMWSRGVTFWQ